MHSFLACIVVFDPLNPYCAWTVVPLVTIKMNEGKKEGNKENVTNHEMCFNVVNYFDLIKET